MVNKRGPFIEANCREEAQNPPDALGRARAAGRLHDPPRKLIGHRSRIPEHPQAECRRRWADPLTTYALRLHLAGWSTSIDLQEQIGAIAQGKLAACGDGRSATG